MHQKCLPDPDGPGSRKLIQRAPLALGQAEEGDVREEEIGVYRCHIGVIEERGVPRRGLGARMS